MASKPTLTHPLHGTWRLLSFVVEEQSSREKRPGLGGNTKGRLVILPNGTMMALVTATRRPTPKSVDDRATSFNTMIAYSGQYTVHGNDFSTKVDLTWNEDWSTTVQV